MLEKNVLRELLELPTDKITPNPRQPRKFFDEAELADLSKSISEIGVIQPIVVHPDGKAYEIIAGERRWRASKLAGLEKIPCIVLDVDDNSRQIVSLVENMNRSDLSPIEEAQSMKDLLESTGWSQSELAGYLGRSQSFVANKIRLLKLDSSVRRLLIEKKLSERQARHLLSVPEEKQPHIAMRMISEGLKGDDLKKLSNMLAPQKEHEHIKDPPSDPAAVFFERLSKWTKENCSHGIPVSWSIKEINQMELVAEIRVDLKTKMK